MFLKVSQSDNQGNNKSAGFYLLLIGADGHAAFVLDFGMFFLSTYFYIEERKTSPYPEPRVRSPPGAARGVLLPCYSRVIPDT